MEQAVKVVLIVVTFGLMVLVGLDLTPQSLRAALGRRRALLAGLVAPWILVPPLILGLVRLLHPAQDVEAVLLLLAACPTGGMANFHAYLARANTALAVTLTTFSCLGASATLPALLWVYSRFSSTVAAFALPPIVLITNVVGLLIVPALIGLGVRRRWPDAVARLEKPLQRIGGVALLVLLGLAGGVKPGVFIAGLGASGPLVLFTVICLAVGFSLTRLAKLSPSEGFAVTMQLPVRNLAIASVIALNLLRKPEYAALASAFFIVQTALLLGAVAVFRRWNTLLASRDAGGDT